MDVPFARPYLTGQEGEAAAAVISSGWLSQGPRVREFEEAFAASVGAADAVATTSCTTALHLALYASGIGPGDEVIVPSLSFIATANAVWQCGATPVFADIDPLTYNLDADAAQRAITARTRAIMPVHQLGLPADMDPFFELAERHGLLIIEDAACAIGAAYKGRPIGSLGALACFSLHPRKVITTGEGGMITVRDPAAAERMRRLRAHAMDLSDLARHNARDITFEAYPEKGFNMRMTDMQAAVGLCQLGALERILDARRRRAERYNELLADVPGIDPPYDPPYARRTWQSYCVRVRPGAKIGRTELMRRLLADGIASRRGVMAIHEEGAYAGGAFAPLPHSEAAARDTLMLPLFPDLTEEQQDYVVDRLADHVIALAA
jgi:perosamine synthetase